MTEHDDAIREALAAERAAAYAQLDPEEYEDLIAATDAALEARPSLVVRGEEELNAALQRWDGSGSLARHLIANGTVMVAPSLVAATREALAKALWVIDTEPQRAVLPDVFRHDMWEQLDSGVDCYRRQADALLALGGPVRLADATPEQAWDEGYGVGARFLPRDTNPYDGFTRKEQNDA